LALYFPRDGIVLAQMEIASKANEITAAPHLEPILEYIIVRPSRRPLQPGNR